MIIDEKTLNMQRLYQTPMDFQGFARFQGSDVLRQSHDKFVKSDGEDNGDWEIKSERKGRVERQGERQGREE